MKNHILKNLHSLIRNATLTYINEFVWQDIKLTNEFKEAYQVYLKSIHYDIEFLGATAVITSPSNKYIYVPNQWFVIAAYAVDVYEELIKYKDFFKKVAECIGQKPNDYARQLRDYASLSDRKIFMDCAKDIFDSYSCDDNVIEEAVSRLWRFVNDYSWWSGQKTIDRGDFYVSVILNLLNLINASQGYVAEIVSAYANDTTLRQLVKQIDAFTIDFGNGEDNVNPDYIIPDEEIRENDLIREEGLYDTSFKTERTRIKINGTDTLMEIKYKR